MTGVKLFFLAISIVVMFLYVRETKRAEGQDVLTYATGAFFSAIAALALVVTLL